MKIAFLFFIVLFAFSLTIGCDSPPDTSAVTTLSTLPHSKVPTTRTQVTVTATQSIVPTETATPVKIFSKTNSGSVVCDCSGNLYNCDDFETRDEAQECFNYCNSQGKGDIHRLDADKDGSACKNNK